MDAVWITGCRGFVGRHLARELTSRGLEVLAVDRPGSAGGSDVAASLDLDLTDADAVARSLRATRPRAVAHLASQSSAALSFERPRETFHTNVDTTLGLLEAVRGLGSEAPRLLSVGSCEEYGPPDDGGEHLIDENRVLRPASPYAVSKAAQTLLCQHYRRTYGLPILCTRSFTHTGPGQSDRFVFSSFARQIATVEATGHEGTLRVGNLAAVRDMSDVRDVVRVYADLLDVQTDYDVLNVCQGRGVRIQEGLDHLLSRARVPIEVEVDPRRLRPSDVPRFVGDPARLREVLGWHPQTPLTTALDDLLQWWRSRVTSDVDGVR